MEWLPTLRSLEVRVNYPTIAETVVSACVPEPSAHSAPATAASALPFARSAVLHVQITK